MTLRNWNRDPFEGTYNPITITDYPMTVSLDPDLGKYGLRLPFAPLRTASSGNMTIKRASDNFELTEVSRTTAPSTNEYRVDYEADTYLGTGWTQFNASNNGLAVLVSCKISGDLIKGGSIPELDADNIFTGDNTFSGNDDYNGSLNVPLGGGITHNGNPVAGYLDDGTAYYRKRLSGSISDGNLNANLAHGLGSIVTNDKVVSFGGWLNGAAGALYAPYVAASNNTEYVTVTDTNLRITRTATTGTYNVGGWIDYIL